VRGGDVAGVECILTSRATGTPPFSSHIVPGQPSLPNGITSDPWGKILPVVEHSAPWANTTHDWAVAVDRDHLDAIRAESGTYAPGGMLHLVLEVLAYADDEAEALGRRGKASVTVHADGSVSVADDGRGTDTRLDAGGNLIKKPVVATKDLRFFDDDHDVTLPDGAPRRGMSVVAALSHWLTHTNRRQNGAWTQQIRSAACFPGLSVEVRPR
jgi:DNA gyrase subunit B